MNAASRHGDEKRARTTRVAACTGGGRTRLESRDLRAPAAGEAVLRLRVAGLCGTDIFKLDNGTAPSGSVLGHEIVGEIVETGAGVDLEPGQRVVVPHHVPCGVCALCRGDSETMCREFRRDLLEPGGFSELILVRQQAVARALRPVPDRVADEVAVFMEPAACVLRGVLRSGMTPDGEGTVVVQGGGSMGLLHLLVLRAVRARRPVVVIDPVPERRSLALELGAAAAAAPGEQARDVVAASSADLGADAVFDTVGGSDALRSALALCREGGTTVLFAHAPAGAAASFDLNDLFKHERRIVGTYSGTVSEQAEVFAAIVAGALDPSPLVTHRLPLGRLDDAVELVRRREALKVLLTPP